MLIKGEYHIPVLLKETIDLLRVKKGKKYIDATLGGGGHSKEVVKREGRLLAIDCDPEAVKAGTLRLQTACPAPSCLGGGKIPPPKVVWGNFSDISEIAQKEGFSKVDGILFDLGVSSHQLETKERGFSFNQGGPLDMRMDPRLSITAKDLVNGLNEGELYELFFKLGQEKYSRRFAHAICRARRIKKIETTDELAKIILDNAPPRGRFDGTHPATRIFQALRIAVNDELNNLKKTLPKAVELLNKEGRLIVLSFHSLEDGIVKRFFLEEQKRGVLEIVTEKPIIPEVNEIEKNPRARSAKLRVAEKK